MNHYSNKTKNRRKFQQLTERQTYFNNNWSVRDHKKQYDALQDKHASYYFIGKSIKQHMKQLKKAVIQDQRNQNKKQRLKSLLSNKIKFKLPEIKNSGNKIDIYSRDFDNLQYFTRKSSRLSPKRKRINISANQINIKHKKSQNLSNFQSQSNENQQLSNVGINQKSNNNIKSFTRRHKSPRNYQNQQQILQNQLINKKQHNKFMKFIQAKKDLIKQKMSNSRQQLSNNEYSSEKQRSNYIGNSKNYNNGNLIKIQNHQTQNKHQSIDLNIKK